MHSSCMLLLWLLLPGFPCAALAAGTPGLVQPVPSAAATVKGQVKNSEGLALAGCSVSYKGSNTGTTTDQNGGFSIQIPALEGTLVFTMVGYLSREIAITGPGPLHVVLLEDSVSLSGVVVVGYGTRKKEMVTGAIAQVDQTVFESRALTNVSNALQGALPGLTIQRSSGRPGREGFDFQVRGLSSVNGGSPLVLIDDVAGDINSLNPNDIASVTVLKDAAASIYGARAADGVILVRTKKGKRGKPQVNYAANLGMKIPDYLKKMVSTLQFAEMTDEGFKNVGLPGVPDEVLQKIRQKAAPDPDKGWVTYLQDYPGFYTDNNWMDAVYGKALQQMHNLSVTGGGESSEYVFSAGYANDNGVFKFGTNDVKRYNLRMNYDFRLFDKLNIQTRSTFMNEIIREPSSLDDVLHNTPRLFNFVPMYNPSGQYYTYQDYINPAQQLEEGGDRTTNYMEFAFNVKANMEIAKGLRLTAQFGVKNNANNDNGFYRTFPKYNWAGVAQSYRNPLNSAYYSNSRNVYKSYTAYAEYDRTVAENHHFGLMAGSSLEQNRDLGTNVSGSNFPGNSIFTLNLADQTKAEYSRLDGFDTDWALNSYFGRFSYGFMNKLFLDATIRMDGSSKFSPDKRWSAVFPSVLVAYNIAREAFIQKLEVIDNLKIRASFGRMGNQEISAFGNYGYIPLISVSGSYPLGSSNAGTPGAVLSIASDQRTWETIETANLGLDFGLLNNRLSGSLDVYKKDNKNMLVDVQVPVLLGGTPPSQNLGHLTTKGFDFSIGWHDQAGKWKYGITAMLSDSKNKLVELKGNDILSSGLNYAHQGYPINSYFGYQFNGIIQNEAQLQDYKKLSGIPSNIGVGDVMYKDVDGDGILSVHGDPAKGSKGDLVYLGSLQPRYTYSSRLELGYGGFDLMVFLQGVGKRMNIRDGSFSIPMSAVYFQPLEYWYGKSWTPEHTDAAFPRIVPGAVGFDNLLNYNWQYSQMRVNDLAYLRVKVVTLGYNLPVAFCKRVKLSNARVYLSGENLFTVSKGTWMRSFDPEEGYSRSDEKTYPFTKNISFGLNIGF